MSDTMAKSVRSAAVAAWLTVLLGAIWLITAWFIWMAILQTKPDWLGKVWCMGSGDWDEIRSLMFLITAVCKSILFVCILVSVWLSLWARRLKRA